LAEGSHDQFADRFTEALLTPEATPRRLDLLTVTVPAAARIAVLWNPGYRSHDAQLAELRIAARGLGVTLQAVGVMRLADLDGAFASVRTEHADALLILTATLVQYHWRGMAERARTSRIPAMAELREFPAAGGLMSYGPSAAARHEGAVGRLDRLVKTLKRETSSEPSGERPPLELVINLKTATILGVTIPQSVLRKAHELMR